MKRIFLIRAARVSRDLMVRLTRCTPSLPLEHALCGSRGARRVSIAGSRAAENWDLCVEGPNGFELSYALSAAAGEHDPALIHALVLKLVPPTRV